MGYPFPKPPLADGTGTTPADMQRIVGAQYMNAGILPNGGLKVVGTSSMAYKVEPGALFMWTSSSAKLGMLVPVDGVTVNTAPAPATGSRVDTLYVDGSGNVLVTQAETIPSGVAIAKFTVPAGITATTAAQQSIDRYFAVPTGASLGRLAQWVDPGGGAAGVAETVRHTSRFFVPSDRLLRIDLTTTLRSAVSSSPGQMYVEVELRNANGSWRRRMDVTHGAEWDTRSANWATGTREGENTLIVRTKGTGGGAWQFSSGGSVTELSVWDGGPNV